MQGIYTYTPETNNVPREYTVAATRFLLFMVPISLVHELAVLWFYVSTFRSMCAVPNMAVFCSSLLLFVLSSLVRPFLPGTSLEPAVIPTAQASSFTLQYFPYYV
jgi:hypothetical protein